MACAFCQKPKGNPDCVFCRDAVPAPQAPPAPPRQELSPPSPQPPVPAPQGQPPAPLDTKACPICGERIAQSALKCRFCGENISRFISDASAAQERVIFSGRPAFFHSFNQVLGLLASIGIAGAGIVNSLPWLGAAPFLYLGLHLFEHFSSSFHLTTHRLTVKRGFFSVSTDSLELFRIDSMRVVAPFSHRLLGFSKLYILSTDPLVPSVEISGVRNLEAVMRELEHHVHVERRRRSVLEHTDA